MTRAWVAVEVFVLWPIAGVLILIGLIPVAVGLGLAFIGNHIERRLRGRDERQEREDRIWRGVLAGIQAKACDDDVDLDGIDTGVLYDDEMLRREILGRMGEI